MLGVCGGGVVYVGRGVGMSVFCMLCVGGVDRQGCGVVRVWVCGCDVHALT